MSWAAGIPKQVPPLSTDRVFPHSKFLTGDQFEPRKLTCCKVSLNLVPRRLFKLFSLRLCRFIPLPSKAGSSHNYSRSNRPSTELPEGFWTDSPVDLGIYSLPCSQRFLSIYVEVEALESESAWSLECMRAKLRSPSPLACMFSISLEDQHLPSQKGSPFLLHTFQRLGISHHMIPIPIPRESRQSLGTCVEC